MKMIPLILILLLPSGLAAQELWEQCTQEVQENLHWYPGRVTMETRLFDEEGELLHQEIQEIHCRDNGGKIELTLEQCLENGREAGRRAKDMIMEQLTPQDFEADPSPFFMGNPSLHYESTDEEGHYRFAFSDEYGDWSGETWIDRESRLPLSTRVVHGEVPYQEDGVSILSTVIELGYTITPEGQWLQREMILTTEIEEPTLFSTFRGVLVENWRYEDHWIP